MKKVTFNFGSFAKIVQYSYDENGNRKTMVYQDGFTVTYVWDADNRLTNIQISGQTWTFGYDADHRRTTATHPNGLELNATHDDAGRLTAIRSKDGGSTVEGFTYTYDKMTNRKTQGQEANSTSLSFGYYPDYSLNATTYESGSKAHYSYDDNENRLFRNETGKQAKYFHSDDSSVSRREEYVSGNLRVMNNYTYDSNGNRIQNIQTDIGQGTTTYTYEYDLENRLTKVLSGISEIASYAYFSDGSRIRRTSSGVATFFLYDFRDFDGFNDILEEYDASSSMLARYVHGPGIDEPLAMSRGGSWYYYHVDGLGSVTMLTRSDKTLANRYVYDDFGGFRSKTEAVTNFYTFTGREYDFAVDLVYYRARHYDPLIGRFLTRDPAGMVDGPNQYVYVGSNPVSRTDPSGRGLVNLWIPCWLTWNWWGPSFKFLHFDTDVFLNCIFTSAWLWLTHSGSLLNPLILFYMAQWCVYFFVTLCWGLIVAAILTGVGWIPAVTCLMSACGVFIVWFVGCIGRSLSCR